MAEKIAIGVIGTGFGMQIRILGFQAYTKTELIAVCSAPVASQKD